MSGPTSPSEGPSSRDPWEEDECQFRDTDGDTNVFRLHGGVVDVEVNGRRLFCDVLTCHLDGHTLQLQTASSKTAVMTVPRGQEEKILRIMALLKRRHEADSIVEFHSAEEDVCLMRISPKGGLQVFVNGHMRLSDVDLCRFDGPGGRCLSLRGSAAKSGSRPRLAVAMGEGQPEVVRYVGSILGKRGLRRNFVEFADAQGDVHTFQLTDHNCLELHRNGKRVEYDMDEVRVIGYDGRTIQCKGSTTSSVIVTTVPCEDLALSSLALFRLRVAQRRGEQLPLAVFGKRGRGRLDGSSAVPKSVKFREDGGNFLEEDSAAAVGSNNSLASSTRCSAISSAASSRSSTFGEEVDIDASLNLGPGTASSSHCPSKNAPRRKPVRQWLLRAPGADSFGPSQPGG